MGWRFLFIERIVKKTVPPEINMTITSRLRYAFSASMNNLKLTNIRIYKQNALKLLFTGAILGVGLTFAKQPNNTHIIFNFEYNTILYTALFLAICTAITHYTKTDRFKIKLLHKNMVQLLKFTLSTLSDTSITIAGTFFIIFLIDRGNTNLHLPVNAYLHMYFAEILFSTEINIDY